MRRRHQRRDFAWDADYKFSKLDAEELVGTFYCAAGDFAAVDS
jgi:hypothetical protein